MREEKYGVGTIHKNNHGTKYIILSKSLKYGNRNIKFLDEFKYEKEVGLKQIKNGGVRNPFDKTLYNIGYLGSDYNSKREKSYGVWTAMIERCYNNNDRIKF